MGRIHNFITSVLWILYHEYKSKYKVLVSEQSFSNLMQTMSWLVDSVLNKTLNFLINSASNPVISPLFSGFRKNLFCHHLYCHNEVSVCLQ